MSFDGPLSTSQGICLKNSHIIFFQYHYLQQLYRYDIIQIEITIRVIGQHTHLHYHVSMFSNCEMEVKIIILHSFLKSLPLMIMCTKFQVDVTTTSW